MTLYHFGNCLALVYAPYHMAYKFSGVSEYATFSKCVYAGGLYIFTQLCKMLLLATFFPDYDSNQATGEYDVFLEILKATVDLADLLGLYFAINSVPGKGHAKILTAAIGWASAEVVVTRSVMLWVGARGSEFDWRYVRAAVESNVALMTHAASAALVWLWTRSDLPRKHAPIVVGLLALSPYRYTHNVALLTHSASAALVRLWTRSDLPRKHAPIVVGLLALSPYRYTHNVALLTHGASAVLVWLWTRSDLPRKHAPILVGLLALFPYNVRVIRALLEDAVGSLLSLSAWSLLAFRALNASVIGLTALGMYAVLAQQIGM